MHYTFSIVAGRLGRLAQEGQTAQSSVIGTSRPNFKEPVCMWLCLQEPSRSSPAAAAKRLVVAASVVRASALSFLVSGMSLAADSRSFCSFR